MPKVESSFEAILQAIEQLDANQVEIILKRLHQLHTTRQHGEEERLLAIWNESEPSEKESSRLEELQALLDSGDILEAEHQELIELKEQVAREQIQRLQALVELARLRKVEPASLLSQIQPPAA